jgi:hypothetical protein
MQTQETRGRFKRLTSRLKGRETPTPTNAATSSQGNQPSQVVNNDYNDRQRAQSRYEEAVTQLKEAIKTRKGPWGPFDFDELSDEPEGFDDAQFKNKINKILTSREASIKDRNGWSKFTYAVECVFTALSPFAKNFLMVAQNAQSVSLTILFDFYANGFVDTRAQSLWLNLRWSLSLNNGRSV